MYIIQNSYYLAYSLLQNVCLCVYVCISLAIYVLNINQSVVGILKNQSIFRLEKMLRVKTICGWKSPTTELYDSRRQAKIFSYQHSHQIKPFYSRGGDRHIQQRSLLNWVCWKMYSCCYRLHYSNTNLPTLYLNRFLSS